ncbi:hypothetical protein BU17DRAFT_81492 [Hysterangium stoloniferum]|nr:hypothetical protein BU17DRAFT_81492 [Hysterangium stoloniferum]
MDYACGSAGHSCYLFLKGAISQRLAPHCKRIVGVDTNPAAVEQYNSRVINQGISPEEMLAVCSSLHEVHKDVPKNSYDVIVVSIPTSLAPAINIDVGSLECSLAYHHFPSIDDTTALLVSFLKPGSGTVLVSDLLKGPHADDFHRHCAHEHNHVVHRGGLTEIDVRHAFEHAGLIDVDFEIIHTVKRDGREVDIFLAQGMRPPHEQLHK